LASATVSGLVSTASQAFAGIKTFTSELAASAGVLTTFIRAAGASLVLRSSLGAGAADKCVVVGTSETDGAVNASAKVWVAATGVGGTQVDQAWVDKAGIGLPNAWRLDQSAAQFRITNGANVFATWLAAGGKLRLPWGLELTDSAQTYYSIIISGDNGRIDQLGTDSSGAPGAATINKPSGKSALAAAATTVTITNSLIASGDQVHVTWHGDLGTQSKIPYVTTALGSFTVTVGTAPAGAVAFCWTVSKRI